MDYDKSKVLELKRDINIRASSLMFWCTNYYLLSLDSIVEFFNKDPKLGLPSYLKVSILMILISLLDIIILFTLFKNPSLITKFSTKLLFLVKLVITVLSVFWLVVFIDFILGA